MTANYNFVIRTCYNYKYKLIFLNNLSVEIFLNECAKAFKIPFDKAAVELTDRENAGIPKELFETVVLKFGSCGYFCVHLKTESLDADSSIVTPHELEEYLIQVNATRLLNQKNMRLTEKNRRELVNHAFSYQTLRFGKKPNAGQKDAIVKATVFLFPSLNFDVVKGYLGIKLRNERATEKKNHRKQNESMHNNENTLNQNESDVTMVDVTEILRRDVEFLKTSVVNDANFGVIKEKLISTLSYRLKMMETPEMDLLESFPYFFTDSTLILFDFSQRFTEINCTAFLDTWPIYSGRLNDILKNQYQSSIYTAWSEDIQNLLVLLKLLPAKANGRNLQSIASFNKAIDKLFVFRQSGLALNELVERNNNFPYIIACGDSQKEISQFYIDVEKHLINVPEHFSAAETFDLFLKAHKIFNLNFETNIQPMVNFVQHFIFTLEVKQFKPTIRMKDLFNRISAPVEQ